MKRYNFIEVKLTQINFVPTWQEKGHIKTTLVGQASIPADKLPQKLQTAIRLFILEGLNEEKGEA